MVEPPQLKTYASQNGSESFPQIIRGENYINAILETTTPVVLLFTPFKSGVTVFHPEHLRDRKINRTSSLPRGCLSGCHFLLVEVEESRRRRRNCSLRWVFPKIGVPHNGWFVVENPIKIDDLIWRKTHYFRKYPDLLKFQQKMQLHITHTYPYLVSRYRGGGTDFRVLPKGYPQNPLEKLVGKSDK